MFVYTPGSLARPQAMPQLTTPISTPFPSWKGKKSIQFAVTNCINRVWPKYIFLSVTRGDKKKYWSWGWKCSCLNREKYLILNFGWMVLFWHLLCVVINYCYVKYYLSGIFVEDKLCLKLEKDWTFWRSNEWVISYWNRKDGSLQQG